MDRLNFRSYSQIVRAIPKPVISSKNQHLNNVKVDNNNDYNYDQQVSDEKYTGWRKYIISGSEIWV